MHVIDGSRGEGGGQVLRTALSLSMLSGEPVKLTNIRAGRAKPGLMRQHLCSVQLAADICGAAVEGAEAGSRELVFKPRSVKAGDYRIAIGTAGSTTLVLQTVLPALLTASGPSTLLLEGGTHNPLAPPFDFLEQAFLPLLARMGAQVQVELERPGFYPAGGGRLRVAVQPVPRLAPLQLTERGAVLLRKATAVVAALSPKIAQRELSMLRDELQWPEAELHVHSLPAHHGPGNVLTAVVASEHVTEVFTGFGEKGVSAESVGRRVAGQVRAYLDAGVPVGQHLADQLLLPLMMAGSGAFRTQELTLHAQTQLELLREFGAALRAEVDGRSALVSTA